MSGTAKVPVAPFVAPTSGDLDQRLAVVAQVITRILSVSTQMQQQADKNQSDIATAQSDITALQTSMTALQAQLTPTTLALNSSDGHTWHVTVSTTGTLVVT
jgi:septal ring factor EnvC (AmiA/AmiB activator)